MRDLRVGHHSCAGVACPAVAVLLLSWCLALPAKSSAASVEFNVQASRGYTITVTGSTGKVTLSADGPAGIASYRVAGKVTRRGLRANFGKLGMVDVSFRPGHRLKLETSPARCRGKPRVTRWGAFVGTIRFFGERGFTRVRARRATGHVRVRPIWKCRRSGQGIGVSSSASGVRAVTSAGEDKGPVSLDLVDRRHRLEGGAFAVGRGTEISLTLFSVQVRERRGRIRIRRAALEFGKDSTFTYDESLTEATVSPPSPFAGTGTFKRSPDGSVAWSGSLSVLLPGAARISLVGPRFTARLTR